MNQLSETLKRVLFVGGHGFITAIDKVTGDEIWRTSLKGSGYGFVNILIEDNRIIAASGGKLYCLAPEQGELLWTNSMSGLGYGIYSLATVENPSPPSTAAIASQNAKSQASSNSRTT